MPIDGLDSGAKGGEADHMLHVPRQEQLLAHVQHQQSLHAIVGKPLPSLGKHQIAKADRVTTIVGF